MLQGLSSILLCDICSIYTSTLQFIFSPFISMSICRDSSSWHFASSVVRHYLSQPEKFGTRHCMEPYSLSWVAISWEMELPARPGWIPEHVCDWLTCVTWVCRSLQNVRPSFFSIFAKAKNAGGKRALALWRALYCHVTRPSQSEVCLGFQLLANSGPDAKETEAK